MNETARRWLEFADIDLRMAVLAFEDEIFSQVCFHSHQCVEKALKALIHGITGKSAPRSHALQELLKHIPSECLARLPENLSLKMDDYYIPTRYPDAIPGSLADGLPDRSDAEQALAIAKAVIDAVKSVL